MTVTVTTTVTRSVMPIPLTPADPEPPHGSVLMVTSTTGTAVQRFYSDGAYHFVTGETVSAYVDLFTRKDGRERPVFLLYAPSEED